MSTVLTFSLGSGSLHAQTLIPLGTVDNAPTPAALSADGTTVVGFAFGPTTFFAFRWTAATGLVNLGTLPNPSSSPFAEATGVSANGSVVVGYSDATPGSTRAFRWTAAGGMQDLGALMLPNGSSHAYGVSGDGAVVVGDASFPVVGYHAFRWTAGTGMTDLTPPSPPGPLMITTAQAANGDGSVAVGIMTDQGFRAARFAGGGVSNLGNIDTTHDSTAVAVSADGSVVAGYADNFNAHARATRWTAGTGTVSLGTLPGGDFAQARTISPDGLIIAGQSDSATASVRGFLWTQATGMLDIHSYLASKGVDLTGWNLRTIRGVTNGATTITGEGSFGSTGSGWIITGLPPLGAAGCTADFGGPGGLPPGDGVHNNNDFIVFIDYFFAHDPHADIGRTGGLPGSDGVFDNNDFIEFINRFFSPCP